MIKSAVVILCIIGMLGCANVQVESTPVVDNNIAIEIKTVRMKYNVAGLKPTTKEKCYKILEIIDIDESGIWYKAGIREGESIIMVENRPGYMATLACINSDAEITRWFPAKIKEQFRVDGDLWLEIITFENDMEFTLRTVIVKFSGVAP